MDLGFLTKEEQDKLCIELLGGMYGNVNAALLFFERLQNNISSEHGLNLSQSKTDPCMFYKKNDDGELKCMTCDCQISGTREEVDKVKVGLKKEFGTTEDGILKKFVGVRYEWQENEQGEPYVIMSIEDQAEKIIRNYAKVTNGKTPKDYSTPGVPGTNYSKKE